MDTTFEILGDSFQRKRIVSISKPNTNVRMFTALARLCWQHYDVVVTVAVTWHGGDGIKGRSVERGHTEQGFSQYLDS